MTLQLTGTWPWWSLLLPALLLSAFTLWVYRRTAPPTPWNVILPALRIVALLCLLFSLLRPVLAKISEQNERGRVALILDDSGSMGVKDQYEDEEAVNVAWDLEWFPQAQRLAIFKQPVPNRTAVSDALRSGQTQLRELRLAEGDRERRRGERRFNRELESAADAVAEALSDVEDAVEDHAYLAVDSDAPAPDSGGGEAEAGLRWRRYDGISGDSLSNLYKADAYPDSPDHEDVRDAFSIPSNAGDNYGTVLSGFLRVPESGNYRFSLTSDDEGALFVRDPESGELERLIHNPQWRPADDWRTTDKRVALEAGQTVYLEARQKEHGGGDHLKVGWTLPDGTVERPIPGHYLQTRPPETVTSEWRTAFQPWRQGVEALESELRALAEMDSDAAEQPDQARRDRLQAATAKWSDLQEAFAELQKPADRALAARPTPEVAAALERLEETSRWELVMDVLNREPINLLDALKDKGELRLFVMEEDEIEPLDFPALPEHDPVRGHTRPGSVMTRVFQHLGDEPITAMGLITDGQLNAGRPLSVAAEAAKDRNVPLFALGIGSESPPDDIAIQTVHTPETAFQDDLIHARAVVRRHGFEDRPLPLTVRRGDKVVHEEILEPGDESRVTVDLMFPEDEAGDHHYVVETPDLEGEILDNNNRHSFHVRVLEDRIRTLLVDETPRWETRYVRMMLHRDNRVDVDTVIISSLEDGRLQRGAGLWPESREDLFAYQTVILGDVDPDHFSADELEDLHDFVTENGGTLILVAGKHHLPLRYTGLPPARVFPVERDPTAPQPDIPEQGEGDIERPLRLTPAGRVDAITGISGDPDLNPRLWEKLPGMNRIEPGLRALPAADVLVETADTGEPVVVRGFAGAGRVLFSGTDSFWRWRDRTRWHYHHRLWSQIILWSAVGRTTGDHPNIKLMTDQVRYGRGETVLLNVRLLDDEQRPLSGAQGVVEVFDDRDEHFRDIPLLPADAGAGEYRAEIDGLPYGRFTFRPRIFELGGEETRPEISVEIGDAAAGEFIHLTQDRARLEEAFDHVAPLHDPLGFLDEIEDVELTRERRVEYEQSFHAILLLIAALALGAEWHFRKQCKLP